MRIATVATGGIGGFLAVRLTQAGHSVAAIARGPHLAAIAAGGLRLRTAEGEATVRPWMVTDDPATVGPVDAVIVAVKAGALDAAAEAARPLVGPDTLVVPFLNGVEASGRLAGILGAGPVGNGVAYISTTVAEPCVIAQTGAFARFLFAEADSRPSARVDALRAAFREAGIEAPDTDDIARDVWSKFVFFAALSGVTAAGRCRMAEVMAHPALTDLFRTAAAETAAAARACGIALPDDIVARTMAFAQGLPGAMRASTAVDLEAGRPLETPWINGAVLRLSAAAGLDAPVNRALSALLAPHVEGAAR